MRCCAAPACCGRPRHGMLAGIASRLGAHGASIRWWAVPSEKANHYLQSHLSRPGCGTSPFAPPAICASCGTSPFAPPAICAGCGTSSFAPPAICAGCGTSSFAPPAIYSGYSTSPLLPLSCAMLARPQQQLQQQQRSVAVGLQRPTAYSRWRWVPRLPVPPTCTPNDPRTGLRRCWTATTSTPSTACIAPPPWRPSIARSSRQPRCASWRCALLCATPWSRPGRRRTPQASGRTRRRTRRRAKCQRCSWGVGPAGTDAVLLGRR